MFLKDMFGWLGIGMMAIASGILMCDYRREMKPEGGVARNEATAHTRWRESVALALLAWGPLVAAAGMLFPQG